jgi:hypothetical protein
MASAATAAAASAWLRVGLRRATQGARAYASMRLPLSGAPAKQHRSKAPTALRPDDVVVHLYHPSENDSSISLDRLKVQGQK